MNRVVRLLVVLALGAFCPFAAADDDKSKNEKIPSDPPPAAPAPENGVASGIQTLRLSLADAARMGTAANLEIQRGSYDTPIAQQGRIAAEASFDTLLTADFTANRTESPVRNSLFGNQVFFTETIGGSAGVQRNLRSGGAVALIYRADRLTTDNPIGNMGVLQGATFEATQPLLRGAGDVAIADIRRAQNNLVAARAGYETDIEITMLNIVTAYFELVFAEDNLGARRKSEEVARRLLSDANSRLEAEVGTPLDVAEARAGVERRVSEVLNAENARGTFEDQLLALIMPFPAGGRPNVRIVPTDTEIQDLTTLPSAGDETRFVQVALAGRPEVRAAKADIATRGIDTLVARNAILPQLDVIGAVSTDGLGGGFGDSISRAAQGQAIGGTIGLQFSLFIGQRAARAEWLRAAWARRQSQLNLRELENQIIVQVRAALRDIDTARGQLTAARAEVKAADEQLKGEILRREQGKSTPFRVLQREDDLTGARTRLGRAAADLRIAEGRLWRAVGSLGDNLGIDARKWAPCASGRCR